MSGRIGNTDDGKAVRDSLKGLSWQDQMDKARALRRERSQQDEATSVPPGEDRLQPIFKRLKRTRVNAVAEANTEQAAETKSPKMSVKPAKERDRGVRLEAAIMGGTAASAVNKGNTGNADQEADLPDARLTAHVVDDGVADPGSLPNNATQSDCALVLVSPVMDGEVLHKEATTRPNATIVQPMPDRKVGVRLAVGIGFGAGLGVGLTVLLGFVLLGPFFGERGNASATVSQDVTQPDQVSAVIKTERQSATTGAAVSRPQTGTSSSVPFAIPTPDTTSPAFAVQNQAGTALPTTDLVAAAQGDQALATPKLRRLFAPPRPEEPPLVPILVPRPRPEPATALLGETVDTAPLPQNTNLPGADRISAMLNAPVKLSDATVETAATILLQTGIELRSVNRVNYKVGSDHIRYYHPADKALATSIAGHIDADVRDFTSSRPRPPAGRIEIYMAGNGRPVTRRQASTAEPVAALRSLRDSIVRTLRR